MNRRILFQSLFCGIGSGVASVEKPDKVLTVNQLNITNKAGDTWKIYVQEDGTIHIGEYMLNNGTTFTCVGASLPDKYRKPTMKIFK